MRAGMPRSGLPRNPAVIELREQQKKTICRFTCKCGATLFEIRARALVGQGQTGKALIEQAHRKHRAETGCEQEIA